MIRPRLSKEKTLSPGTHRKAGFHPCFYSPSSETLTAKGSTCQAAWELEVQIQERPNLNPYSNQTLLASVIVGHAEVFEHYYKPLSFSQSMTLFNPQVKRESAPLPCSMQGRPLFNAAALLNNYSLSSNTSLGCSMKFSTALF